ncbi:MAG TPA: hypothetical protein VJZ32_09990 [Candidatus Bathyarchaeia archaeon]|nr:hypothetical protein [Candidatus Bathyarchaeia archaeon]
MKIYREFMRIPKYHNKPLQALPYALVIIMFAFGSLAPVMAQSSRTLSYNRVNQISLPGSGGHGDWVTYDPANGYVYLGHHGSDLIVINTANNSIIADVDGIPRPNGIAYDSDYVYVTSAAGNFIAVVSKSDWTLANTVKTNGTTPDGIWYSSTYGRVYVASDDANHVESYAAGLNPKLLNIYPLLPDNPKSGPDVGVLVDSKSVLYMPDDNLVLCLNLTTGQLTNQLNTNLTIGDEGATKNMIYDNLTNRLWVATTDNQTWVLDADTLKQITILPATAPDDQMAFDPAMRLVYTFGGTGFDVYDADSLQHVMFVDTSSPITHTGTVDTANHEVYAYEGQANVVGVYALTVTTPTSYSTLAVGVVIVVIVLVAVQMRRRSRLKNLS